MAVQIRGTLPVAYDGIDKTVVGAFGAQLEELPYLAKRLYNTKDSNKKFERFTDITFFGDVPEKPEGEQYTFDLVQPGYTKDLTPVEFGLGFEVTETAMEDDEIDQLVKAAQMLMFSARYTQETYAAKPFNLGFTTELAPDGLALFSTVHKLGKGGTAANTPTAAADLSHKALQDAVVDQAKNLKMNSGQLAPAPDAWMLVVPPDLEFTAAEIINSTLKSDTADNATNALKRRRWDIVVWPHLTDSDTWFLVAANKKLHNLMTIPRVPIQPKPRENDPRTGNRLYKLRFRQVWGNTGWRNVYGIQGA